MKGRSLLVVGARKESLGEYIADEANDLHLFDRIDTAGISGDELYHIDVTIPRDCNLLFRGFPGVEWTDVVCTVGVNTESTITGEEWRNDLAVQFHVNTIGPLNLLHEWVRYWLGQGLMKDGPVRQFVAISSNSAHVARSKSLGYCASKAALSMGLRCAARDLAELPFSIYGYEPGWIDNTPMSREVMDRLGSVPTHRIPSGKPLEMDELAVTILNNLEVGSRMFNGCMLRIDGGEQ